MWRDAFQKLVNVLWRLGDAGRIPFSAILIVNGEQVFMTTVGVLGISSLNPQAFLTRTAVRESQSAPAVPFSPEAESAISELLAELGKKNYTLVVFHPGKIADIVVENGETVKDATGNTVDGCAYALGAISMCNPPIKYIGYLVPEAHQTQKAA